MCLKDLKGYGSGARDILSSKLCNEQIFDTSNREREDREGAREKEGVIDVYIGYIMEEHITWLSFLCIFLTRYHLRVTVEINSSSLI